MKRFVPLFGSALFLLSILASHAQPANDTFNGRILLTGAQTNVTASNAGATGSNGQNGEPDRIDGARYGATVWWQWTAPAAGTAVISTAGSSFDTVLGVFTGSPGSLVQVAANNNAAGGGTTSRAQFSAVAGTAYQILIGGIRFCGQCPSDTGTIQLGIVMPPSITITAPAAGAIINFGSNFSFSANASSPSPPIRRVEFYRAGALLGTDTNPPYSITVSNSPPGTNALAAVVIDTANITASATVNVAVLNTGVTIVSPADGALFVNLNPIPVNAVGIAPSGSVTNVQFFVDGQPFGQSSTVPFSVAWASPVAGVHRFTAIGRDTTGLSHTSAPVLVSVAQMLIASNSVWKFNDLGIDQGTAWVAPGFDDSGWSSGAAELGYGNGDEATVISFGPVEMSKYPTAYFRRAFFATNAASLSNLTFYLKRDDGAVAYLNGREVFRSPNMPLGTISYLTLTTDANGINDTLDTVTLSATNLVEGTNVMAVEVHQQAVTSSDLSFTLEMIGRPLIPRNQPPALALISPTNAAYFLAPSSIVLEATAADPDAGGSVAKVEFFVDGVKFGESTNSPYSATWDNPLVGAHVLQAAATDDQGDRAFSAPVNVVVYDALGTPWVRITGPTNGQVFDGPTNLVLIAQAAAIEGVAEVQFQTNGVVLGTVFASPYSLAWSNAAFGTNIVTATVYDNLSTVGASAPVTVIVTPPPPNLSAPTIAGTVPLGGITITSLVSIQVTFTERVVGVDAGDLLLDGVPALSVTGSGSNYTFTVAQPPYGEVFVHWNPNHGIEDVGYPPRPFNIALPGVTWAYNLIDGIPPVIAARVPAAGATVTNLSQISVTFSERVSGVNASDLLINGTPAFGLSGSGSNYTLAFAQPAPGPVNISWAGGHGIADLAANPFNAAAATWSYVLQAPRVTLVASNAVWRHFKGLSEASSPATIWRDLAFDDTAWPTGNAAFYYGDPYTGTLLTDMANTYSTVFVRKQFNVLAPAAMTNMTLWLQIDDGGIVWINGVEVQRVRMGAGEQPYGAFATGTTGEGGNSTATPTSTSIPNPAPFLVPGVNVIAIQAVNQAFSSSDFAIDAELTAELTDLNALPPVISSVSPPAGPVFALSNLTVTFSKAVVNVDAADLLVNGTSATGVSGAGVTRNFTFLQPAYGTVAITWAVGHGITDTNAIPLPFNATAAGATFQYSLLNPSAPMIASQTPLAGAAVLNTLTQITVNFSEPVTGVDAADLRVNGQPASGVTGGPATHTFTFAQPAYGPVTVNWSAGHGITDLEAPANPFDAARAGSSWGYTLVDQAAPSVLVENPAAGSLVTNLTQLSITFSEPVGGVNAADLRINGTAAAGVSGSGAGPYDFTFAQPNATLVNVTWAPAHGITDLAATPNLFNATAAGATWSYTSPDNVAPAVALIEPRPFVTLKSLTQVRVTFTEPVTGLGTNDLRMNNVPARLVSGSGAGPYTFTYLPPAPGPVAFNWITAHGITDLAIPAPNSFPGGEWSYHVDPAADFAGKILISEIMFDPPGGAKSNEWIELRSAATNLLNLTGWRFNRGVDFTFPNVSIPAGGHLVVAADLAAFQAGYPAVSNVIGGWTGSLANSDETLELETALGETVNSVHYASDGNWGQRVRGNGSERVEGIVRNGTTATVTIFQHTYSGNDQVIISGADQPEYNGRFTVSGAGGTTFNITVAGTAASPATGNIICRWVLDDANAGWSWYSAAGGFGSSLELANAALPNASGQNWLASTTPGGTPGRANSVATNNLAPLIDDVAHFPPVPRSTNSVSITARVRDELSNGVSSVTLFYRNHTAANPGLFSSAPMLDNGLNQDGVNGDGLFGAVLLPNSAGTVVEFYVQAEDTSGRIRTWPAPALDTNGPGSTFGAPGQFANALYQVDNEDITNPMGSIRLVLSGTDRALFPPGNRQSDTAPNATFISTDGDGTKVRYLASVRVRGAGSRTRTPPNNRIDLASDNRWNGASSVNLNAQYVHAQLLGNNLALKSGVPTEVARVVQYRINGSNPARITAPPGGNSGDGWGVFLLLTPPNGDLAETIYPQDGDGNFYRASTTGHNADLSYQGGIPANYLGRGYYKTSNKSENNWSDFAALTFAFEQVAADANYVQAISTNVNVPEWMRYFALGSLLNFGETSLFNGIGDDYALYRGNIDRRFVAVAHDFDTILGQGDTGSGSYPVNTNSSLFLNINPPNGNANIPLLRRFMTHPAFVPIYYAEIKRLADTVFHPTNVNPVIDQLLGDWNGPGPDATVRAAMKEWANNRRSVILSQIPLALTVSHALSTQSGFPYTTAPIVALSGTAHAIDTRRVLVNGVPAAWSAYGATWTANTALQPGINRVLVQSLNSNDVEFARATLDLWYDDSSVTSVSGALATDTTWSAASGPYQVTGTVTVNSGVTLTIQPGATVFLSPGASLSVANGGRLLAEGLDTARIRFSAAPGAGNWGGLNISGGAGSPETRIAYAHFENNGSSAVNVTAGGELFLDHCSFGNTAVRYLNLDGASFVVQDCHFPAATAAAELIHGATGIKTGGRGLFARNFIGRAMGYNDAIDFTGGNRPGPILQIIDNVFMGSDDDLLDLDSTDAWIEGNIFLHTHRNGSPDSASAISGGADNADTSQITAVGNLFFDVDHAANAKQGNFYTLLNNTIVHQTKVGSQDTNTAVIILADVDAQGAFTAQGAGLYLEGNIIQDAENLTRHVTTAQVTFTNNIIHQLTGTPWSGPGSGNSTNDPLLKRIPSFAETTGFANWAQAQVMWDWFSLRSGSPARGAGPGGLDKGGVIPAGVSITGEPAGTTPLNTATLRVGPLRTGFGIPVAGFPNGSGFTHYRWRLDGGPWSAETPAATPITLSGLANGPHYVEASGRNDAGYYQDNPVFDAAAVTVSRTWTVNLTSVPLHLNEILAVNNGASNHFGTTPDLVELLNTGATPLDLGGMGLTDDPANPFKFIFPLNTTLGVGAYLTVLADSAATPGTHLGFTLPQSGGALYLYSATGDGGALIDSLAFGLQLPNLSLGRLADGSWSLCAPTFSGPNRAAQTGDPRALKINEWLALASAPFDADFVELLNGDLRPVALGGLYISDEPFGWPSRHQFAPLSFIGGSAYLRLIADGNQSAGADHLDFSLDGEQGDLGLFLPDLTTIDCIVYQAQTLNVSQGRSPNGSQTVSYFATPTPGAPNPLITGPAPTGGLVINEILAVNTVAGPDGRTPDWIELYNGTANTVALGDLSLTDNSIAPRKFVFAPGATLASGAHLRILCDPGSTNVGPLVNTNFAIRSSGGALYLFDAPAGGGSLLGSITYGIQLADLSIGRVPDGSTNWVLTSPTPGTLNVAVPSFGDPATLRLNEWMAAAGSGRDDWFEIYNPGNLPVALGGLHLSDDLNSPTKHKIAALSFIGSGTNGYLQFVADGNTGAGADHVGFSLNATNEALGLYTAGGSPLNEITFQNQQTGVSEGRFPDGGTIIVSFPGTESPAEPNFRLLTTVAINEVLTHTDLPLEDAIELRNLTGSPIDVSGWWLSDDQRGVQKYQIPFPTVLPPFGFAVIYETHFTNQNEAAEAFALSSRGDEVVLSAASNNALTGYRAFQNFGAAMNGATFGRYFTSDGRAEFVALSSRTLGADDPGSVEEFRAGTGATNAYPAVGPVVVSEIMYHPPDDGTNDNSIDEFIELRNITTAPVLLYDPAHPTNTWRLRDAVDFDFPPGSTIPAGGYLLVVSFDPVNNPGALAAFRATYAIDPATPVTGPWSGKLANDNDDIELRRPDAPDADEVPYPLVERVHYHDLAPWPALADGTGFSLQRSANNEFGDDPANWTAAPPTAGPQDSALDSDGDGLPDAWEYAHGFDPFNAADAALDTDGDGLTNLQEYQLGTDPRDATSGLRLSITLAPGGAILSFNAASNFTYTIEYADTLGAPWQTLEQFSPAPTNRVIIHAVPASNPARFYRLRAELVSVGGSELIITPGPGGNVTLSFNAAPDFSYFIDYTDALGAPWQLLEEFPSAPTNRVITRIVAPGNPARFYRLRSVAVTAPLRFESIQSLPGNEVMLTFNAAANQSHTVLFKPDLNAPAWIDLASFPAVATNRVLQAVVPAPGSNGFYRLRSP